MPGSHKANHKWPDEVYPHPGLASSHLVHQPSLRAGDMLCVYRFQLSSISAFGPILTVWSTCGCRIFTEALIHGTTYWTGAQDRRLVSFKFCPGHVQYIHPSNPMCSEHLLPFATSVRRPEACCVANCATAATVEFVARRTCSGNCWTVHGWGGARWRSRQRPGSRCPCPTPRRRGRGGTRWQSTLQCWPSAARGCENGRT